MTRRPTKTTVAFSLLFALCCLPTLAQVRPAAPGRAGVPVPKPAPTPGPAAQPTPEGTTPAAEAATPSPPPEWVSRCASDSRQGALDCLVEQTAFLSKTGQLVAAVVIRVPSETHQPMMNIQIPVGLFLPAGVSVRIDEGMPLTIAVQTCDLKGCYAVTPVSAEMLAALKAGKKLSIVFQNLTKDNITVPLQLSNFAVAYQKIQ
jgi:invasion protein IalB